MFDTLINPNVLWVFWSGVAVLLIIFLIIMVIGYLRLMLVLGDHRERKFLAVWQPILVAAMCNAPVIIKPIARRDRVYFLKIWNHFHSTVRGSASVALNEVAQSVGVLQFARSMLNSLNRGKRLLGILTLGNFSDTGAWDVLEKLAFDNDKSISINAIHALVRIDGTRAAALFMPVFLDNDDLQLPRIASIIQEQKVAFSAALLDVIIRFDSVDHVLRALQLAEAIRFELPACALTELLRDEQPTHVLCAALRVASAPELLTRVRGLIDHPDWVVRVQVAKVLGKMGERDDIDLLSRLLVDEQWWVRYRAAEALACLPFLSKERFSMMLEETTDRYGRDMLAHVIAVSKN